MDEHYLRCEDKMRLSIRQRRDQEDIKDWKAKVDKQVGEKSFDYTIQAGLTDCWDNDDGWDSQVVVQTSRKVGRVKSTAESSHASGEPERPSCVPKKRISHAGKDRNVTTVHKVPPTWIESIIPEAEEADEQNW